MGVGGAPDRRRPSPTPAARGPSLRRREVERPEEGLRLGGGRELRGPRRRDLIEAVLDQIEARLGDAPVGPLELDLAAGLAVQGDPPEVLLLTSRRRDE